MEIFKYALMRAGHHKSQQAEMGSSAKVYQRDCPHAAQGLPLWETRKGRSFIDSLSFSSMSEMVWVSWVIYRFT